MGACREPPAQITGVSPTIPGCRKGVIILNDQKAVAEKEEETKTSQDSSPQSEDPATEDQTTQEEEPQEQDEEADQEELEEESDSEEAEPKGMTEEQRKAFQEMRLENKRLKEEQGARKKGESAFDVFKPKTTGPVDINNFVDSSTGNVDWNAYNQAVVSQAQTAATQTVSEQLDEAKAREKYPEVFADPDLEEAVAGKWIASKLQGQEVSISDIASKLSKKLTKATTKAEKEGAKKALTELTPKEEAALSAQGQSSSSAQRQANAEDLESLRLRARRGDEDAMATLMSRVAWKK